MNLHCKGSVADLVAMAALAQALLMFCPLDISRSSIVYLYSRLQFCMLYISNSELPFVFALWPQASEFLNKSQARKVSHFLGSLVRLRISLIFVELFEGKHRAGQHRAGAVYSVFAFVVFFCKEKFNQIHLHASKRIIQASRRAGKIILPALDGCWFGITSWLSLHCTDELCHCGECFSFCWWVLHGSFITLVRELSHQMSMDAIGCSMSWQKLWNLTPWGFRSSSGVPKQFS